MKKVISFLIILIGITIILFIIKDDKNISQVFTFKKSYNYLYTEEFTSTINLYFEDENNCFKDINDIEEVKLFSEKNLDFLTLALDSISINKRVFENKLVYEQKYSFKIQELGDDIYFESASFYLKNAYAENITISIGDFYAKYQSYESDDDLSFSEVQGVFNVINNINTLGAIQIKFDNKSSAIKITNIELGDPKIFVNSKNILKITQAIENNSDLKKLQPLYQTIEKKEEFIPINVNSSDYLLIFISYEELKFLGNTFLKIDYYDENNIFKVFYLNNFDFIRVLDLSEYKGSITFYGYTKS